MAHAANVIPDDANDLVHVTRGISLTGAGILKVTTLGGETLVIPSGALAAGVIHQLRISTSMSDRHDGNGHRGLLVR